MTLLVVGGTGTLGRQIVSQALEDGFKVRCLVRNVKKASFLSELGATLIYGDLAIPETLPSGFKEITGIIDASTIRVDDVRTLKETDCIGKEVLIEIAKAVKIKRFLFFSLLNAQNYMNVPLMEMKNNIEQKLIKSTIPFTIIRLGSFYQALINQYAIPILENKTIWITNEFIPRYYMNTQDIARICLRSIANSKTKNKSFTLCGERAWFSSEIIEMCEKLSGQSAKLTKIPLYLLHFAQNFSKLFEWSDSIQQRLAFIKVLEEKESISKVSKEIYNFCEIDEKELLNLESYLQEYFEEILKTLRDVNYEQTLKRRDFML
uniref:Ycf39 n=1 Tax=Haramonas pauciplastida TaxID=478668 RepID=UPI002113D9D5|nr:Ycf39 [Haramonas pauciplastida]UTE94993.1 Ycf39 [Haramonas pauciplastida]